MTGGPGPGVEESRYLEGVDGVRLHYRAWPADSPRAALLVVHGLLEHSRRYRELAREMVNAGIATFGLDLRGHGASGGRRVHVRSFDHFLEDLDRFGDHVAASMPGVHPTFLLGHSMGGLVTLRYLEERAHGLAGAIVTAPWLAMAEEPPALLRVLARVLDTVAPILPFPAGLDPEDLSHDPERVADYRDDPQIPSTLTPRLWAEVGQAWEEVFHRRDRIDIPLLFLLAGEDRIASTDRSLQLARSLDVDDVTIGVLDGYYHEVLQEVERAVPLAEIRSWIEARLP